MQFEIDLPLLKEVVKLVNVCVHKKPLYPSLSCIKIDANAIEQKLTVSSFDLCNALVVNVSCKVEVSGKILVPAQDISKLLSMLEGDSVKLYLQAVETDKTNISLMQDKLCLEMPRKKLYLSCLPTDDFVALPSLVKEKPIQFVSTDFIHAINRIIKTASVDDTKTVLTGANISLVNNSVRFSSTNGHCLATATIPSRDTVTEKTSVTLNKTFCQLLTKFEELEREESTITIYVDKNNVVETEINVAIAKHYSSQIKIISRILDGVYPATEKLIPVQSKSVFTINKKELINAMNLNSYFTNTGVKFCTYCETIISEETGESQLRLSCSTNEKGNAITVIPVQFQTQFESIKFGINPSYMVSLLSNLSSEDVTILVNDSVSPILIKGINEPIECLMLVMPVSLKD